MPAGPERFRSLRLCWFLLLLLPATGILFFAQARQAVDPTNAALKAPGTVDDLRRRALAEVVPSEQVVLLCWRVPGEQPVLAEDAVQLQRAREAVAAIPGVLGCRVLPAPAEGMTLVAVDLTAEDPGHTGEHVVATARELGPASMRFSATGLPLLESRLARIVSEERSHIVPLLGGCLFVLAYAVYRRFRLAIAVLLPPLLAITWTTGIVSLLGHPLDPVAALLDPVLLTLGVATSVHFVECWNRACREGLEARLAARSATRQMQGPTLLATVTTMVGLVSLAVSDVPAVIDFGIRSALGLALLHAFVFLLLPTWLGRGAPAPAGEHAEFPGSRWLAVLDAHRLAIGATAISLTALTCMQLPALRADNDPVALLPATEPARAAHDELAARLGGVEVFHLLFARGEGAGIDPARLLPFLGGTQLLPGVAGMGGQLLCNADGDVAAPILLAPGGSAARTALFGELERTSRVLGLEGIVPAGASVQIARDSDRLVRSLVGSTVWTIVLLGIGMCVGMRSLRHGLLGLVPAVLPCIWVYGALSWLDHPVSVATGMIACTMLGLLVDNVIHFLHHYRAARKTCDVHESVATSLSHVGRPMILGSLLLVTGFAVAATSQLSTTVEFSLLACSTILAALVSTSVLLPLLLLALRRESSRTSHVS